MRRDITENFIVQIRKFGEDSIRAIKPDFCNVGGLQMFVDGEWEDWYLETEDDYFDDVDEYCKKCERSEEIDNFSKDLFEQIDFKTLYTR